MNKQNNQNNATKLIIGLLMCGVVWVVVKILSFVSIQENSLVNVKSYQLVEGTKGSQIFIESAEQNELQDIKFDQFENEKELQQFVKDMMKWGKHLPDLFSGCYHMTQLANFGYKLHTNPNSSKHLQAEYYYFHNKYKIGYRCQQTPMCIVAAGKNLLKNQKYKPFFMSINRQNYTNFRLIVADDSSPDYSAFYIRQYIKSTLKHLHGRTTLIYNYQGVGALANKDSIIRKYCQEGSIVVDVDADDALIGRQVFNVLNSIFRNKDVWFAYSNHVVLEEKYPEAGMSDYLQEHILKEFRYRSTQQYWVTGQIRSYRRELYMSIPLEYFLNETGGYYPWASDRFIMYAITELSAQGHYYHIPECLYFYNRNPPRPDCVMARIIKDQYVARALTPFKPLKNLHQKAQQVENYKLPEQITYGLNEKMEIWNKCPKTE